MITTVTTKEVIHQNKHQPRFHRNQAGTFKRSEAHHIQAGWYEQGMHILTELDHLHAIDGYLSGTAHHIKQTDTHMAGKPLVHHFQCWHTATDNTILRREIVFHSRAAPALAGFVYFFFFNVVDTM